MKIKIFSIIFCLGAFSNIYSQVSSVGLVSYYPFSSNANDESGNDHHGTVYGATLSYDRCGNPNSSYYFDGVDDEIIVQDDEDLGIGNFANKEFSISVWVNLEQVAEASIYSVLSKRIDHSSNTDYWLVLDNYLAEESPILGLVYGTGQSSDTIAWMVYEIPESKEWHHIVTTVKNDEYNTGIKQLYIDGRLIKEGRYYTKAAQNNRNLIIGNTLPNDGFSRHFHGNIDDIMIYTRVLSSSEVLELYNTECLEQNVVYIEGNINVCQLQQNATFITSEIVEAVNYTWKYTGTGMIISEGGNSILANFSEDATSGKLSVDVELSDGTVLTSDDFNITVNSLPFATGVIFGDTEVCLGGNGLNYSIPEVENANSYIWEYSGDGTTIFGDSENITINYSDDATDGYISVHGINTCGIGDSDSLAISLKMCQQIPSSLKIPNSFSPNGDNINDLFTIGGLEENAFLLIFNRSGKKLYESHNYQNDWDGSDLNGNALPTGTYWYVLRFPGIPTTIDGFIYLKR